MNPLLRRIAFISPAFLLLMLTLRPLQAAEPQPASLSLVPWPQSVQLKEGQLAMTDQTRIVATDPQLQPLATILSDELFRLTGQRFAPAAAPDRPGDIVLSIDPTLKDEHHALAIADRALLRGGNCNAVATASATLLQALKIEPGRVSLPLLDIDDQPDSTYRGLMIDVARKNHSVDSLKQIIVLCRLYKIRYLQLHLTDSQAFTFPSTAFPRLITPQRSYTLEQLRDLEQFASRRGVIIVPEFDVPGHSAAVNKAMPELFRTKNGGHATLNFAREKTVDAVKTIITEMCDVFRSSPYFHLGGDECWFGTLKSEPEFIEAFQKYNVTSPDGLYCSFLGRLAQHVKTLNKKAILWEGFHGDGNGLIPRQDVIVMSFELTYNSPESLVKHGFTVINASWTPLYVVNNRCQTPEHIYDWNSLKFGPYPRNGYENVKWCQLQPTPLVIGAQMCAWEQTEPQELPSLRGRVAPMSERLWNTRLQRDFADFQQRFARTDAILDKLLGASPATSPSADRPN